MSETPTVDAAGYPWDERIHVNTKKVEDDGTWRLRRGVSKELVDEVRGITPEPSVPETKHRTIKTRNQAISVLNNMNERYNKSDSTEDLIAKAEKIPVEKYYKIEIQEKDEENATAQAAIRVVGKVWRITRGEKVIVPARVLTAMDNAITYTPLQRKKRDGSGENEIYHVKRREETYLNLGEVPAPK